NRFETPAHQRPSRARQSDGATGSICQRNRAARRDRPVELARYPPSRVAAQSQDRAEDESDARHSSRVVETGGEVGPVRTLPCWTITQFRLAWSDAGEALERRRVVARGSRNSRREDRGMGLRG